MNKISKRDRSKWRRVPLHQRLPLKPNARLHLSLMPSTDHHGNNLYRVTENYTHHDGTVVPAGFVTNMGTIPRALHAFVPPSAFLEASVVHDFRL